MTAAFRVVLRVPSAEEYLDLRRSVGWTIPDVDLAREALGNSVAAACAETDETTIGMARVVGDGGLYWYLQDVVVRPEWQRQGVGSALVAALEAETVRQCPRTLSLGLVTDDEKVAFYGRLGYERDSVYMSRPITPDVV